MCISLTCFNHRWRVLMSNITSHKSCMYFAFTYQPIIDIEEVSITKRRSKLSRHYFICAIHDVIWAWRKCRADGIIMNLVGTIVELLEIRDTTSSKVWHRSQSTTMGRIKQELIIPPILRIIFGTSSYFARFHEVACKGDAVTQHTTIIIYCASRVVVGYE